MFEKHELQFWAVALLVMALILTPYQWALVIAFVVVPVLFTAVLTGLFVLVDIVIDKIKTQTGG